MGGGDVVDLRAGDMVLEIFFCGTNDGFDKTDFGVSEGVVGDILGRASVYGGEDAGVGAGHDEEVECVVVLDSRARVGTVGEF